MFLSNTNCEYSFPALKNKVLQYSIITRNYTSKSKELCLKIRPAAPLTMMNVINNHPHDLIPPIFLSLIVSPSSPDK